MTGMAPGHHHGHAHAHGHGHGHAHGASRGGDPARNRRRVGIAAVLTGSFMVAEAVAGMLSGSLALIADAGHMLADAASLSLAWIAFRVAERPHDWTRTYGFHRVHVLAAYTNGLTLFFVTIAIVVEAVHRLREPVTVLGGPDAGGGGARHRREHRWPLPPCTAPTATTSTSRARCCTWSAICWARLPPSSRRS